MHLSSNHLLVPLIRLIQSGSHAETKHRHTHTHTHTHTHRAELAVSPSLTGDVMEFSHSCLVWGKSHVLYFSENSLRGITIDTESHRELWNECGLGRVWEMFEIPDLWSWQFWAQFETLDVFLKRNTRRRLRLFSFTEPQFRPKSKDKKFNFAGRKLSLF